MLHVAFLTQTACCGLLCARSCAGTILTVGNQVDEGGGRLDENELCEPPMSFDSCAQANAHAHMYMVAHDHRCVKHSLR